MSRAVVVVVVTAIAGCGGLPGPGDGALIHLAEALAPNELVCQEAAPGYPALGTRACALTIDPIIGERSFTIVNRGDTTLFIDSVVFVDGDPGFTLLSVERELEPEERGDVVIGFQPTGAASARTAVHIGSNAVNDPVVVVDVVSAPGCMQMQVTPASCGFGVVAVGQPDAICALSINNTGTCELIIDDVGFSADTPADVFRFVSGFSIPTLIPGGSGVTFSISAHPQDAQTSSGTAFVRSFAGDVDIPLLVTGAEACVARVSRVNGVDVVGPPFLTAGDEIELSSDRSVPARPGGTIAGVAWVFLARPPGASATLSSTTATNPRLRVDVAGAYRVRLTVTDDLGGVSSCGVDLDVQPARPSVSVQLSTTVPAGDLHVVRGDVDWCGADDCFAGNPDPDWGDADPAFAADGGQSVISFRAAPNEDYTVGVGRLDGTATVRVFVNDQLEFEAFQALGGGQEWLPLRIDVRDGVASLVELNDRSDQPGACFEP